MLRFSDFYNIEIKTFPFSLLFSTHFNYITKHLQVGAESGFE